VKLRLSAEGLDTSSRNSTVPIATLAMSREMAT
jgi:hypothetical protein